MLHSAEKFMHNIFCIFQNITDEFSSWPYLSSAQISVAFGICYRCLLILLKLSRQSLQNADKIKCASGCFSIIQRVVLVAQFAVWSSSRFKVHRKCLSLDGAVNWTMKCQIKEFSFTTFCSAGLAAFSKFAPSVHWFSRDENANLGFMWQSWRKSQVAVVEFLLLVL